MEAARASYQQAIQVRAGDYAEAWYNLGILEREAGQPQAAIQAYQQAIEAEPEYPQAWAGLARSKLRAAYSLPGNAYAEARGEARAAANRAVELAPDLPEALASRAVSRLADWDWTGAKIDIDRALEVDPMNPYALSAKGGYLGWMGRLPEAMSLGRQEVERNPLSSATWNSIGVGYWLSGQYDEAERAFIRAGEIYPTASVRVNRGLARRAAGHPEEALAYCKALQCQAMIQFALGNTAESQKALDALMADARGDRPYMVAMVYAFQGDKDRAFEWLDRARAGHVRILGSLKVDTFFRPLHSDPRWAELLRKMNLPVD